MAGTKLSAFIIVFVILSKLVEVNMEVPHWLTNVDKNILRSSPEELRIKADLTVATDGTGNFKTVKEAVQVAPQYSKRRFIIYVKKGVYTENIIIGKAKKNLTLIGDGRDATILTGSLNAHDGVKTYNSATLVVDGEGFLGQDICIQNLAGPAKGQAVALRVSADRLVIHRCRIEAYLLEQICHNC